MKPRRVYIACLPILLLALSGKSMAGYSSYVNISPGANNMIYSTALVDGSAYPMAGACHTPKVYNVLNGTGGWASGGCAPPQNYISFQNMQQTHGTPGVAYTNNTIEQVICTIAGLFFNTTINVSISLRVSYWGPPVTIQNDLCYWGSLACTPGTTATCTRGFGITFAPACPQYVKATWAVVNGSCIPVPYVEEATGPGPCD